MPVQFELVAKTDNSLIPSVDIDNLTWFEGNLISTDSSGSLRTWSPELKLLDEFNPHGEYPVYHLATDEPNKRMFTCSSDGKIHEWKRVDNKWIKINTLDGHDGNTIRRVFVNGNLLFSGDEAGNVKVWENGKSLANFDLMEEIWDMLVIHDMQITVRNKDVTINDLVKSSQGDKFRCCTRTVLPGRPPLFLTRNKLCFADRNGMDILVVNDFKSDTRKITKLEGHKLILNALTASGNHLFSGGWEKKIIAWDLEKFGKIGEIETSEYTNAMTVGPNGRLYIAGENCIISVYKIS